MEKRTYRNRNITAFSPELNFIEVLGIFDKEAYTALEEKGSVQSIEAIQQSLLDRLHPWIEEPYEKNIPPVQVLEVSRDTAIHAARIAALLTNNFVLVPVIDEFYNAKVQLPNFSDGIDLIDCDFFGISPKRVIAETVHKRKELIGRFAHTTYIMSDFAPAIMQMSVERSWISLLSTGIAVPAPRVY